MRGIPRIVAVLGITVAGAAHAQATVSFLDYHTTVPAGWTVRAPSSSSRLAEYVTPGGAEVVVYFFGKGQGGNVEANVARWRAQFSTSDGSPVPESIVRDSSAAFPTTVAEFRGNYRRGIGMGSADSVRIGQTLDAAIVESPHGTLFNQLFGPSAAVANQKAAFLKFIEIK